MQSQPIPEKPIILAEHLGKYPPVCFTEFMPQYNDKFRLSNIIVQNRGWNRNENFRSQNEIWGYKDSRPFYYVRYMYFFFFYIC